MADQIYIPKQINSTPEWRAPDYQWTTKKHFGILTMEVPPKLKRDYDSAWKLVQLGIKVTGTDWSGHRYAVNLPKGATVEESSYTTYIYINGERVASCFDKWASYDSVHHVTFLV